MQYMSGVKLMTTFDITGSPPLKKYIESTQVIDSLAFCVLQLVLMEPIGISDVQILYST